MAGAWRLAACVLLAASCASSTSTAVGIAPQARALAVIRGGMVAKSPSSAASFGAGTGGPTRGGSVCRPGSVADATFRVGRGGGLAVVQVTTCLIM